jgi:periplasmic protein TonB
MVLSQRPLSPLSAFRFPAFQIDRSVALAAVLALHLGVGLWLAAPISFAPDPVAPAPVPPMPRIETDILPAHQPQALPTPPLPTPRERVQTMPQRTPAPVAVATQPDPVDTAPWSEPVQVSTGITEGPATAASSASDGDLASPLAYDTASPPPYPRESAMRGHQGTVTLRVLVDPSGRVLRVEIERGSGHRELDLAAQRHVRRFWRFHPARQQGVPMAAWALVPIHFSLDR